MLSDEKIAKLYKNRKWRSVSMKQQRELRTSRLLSRSVRRR